MLLIVIFLIPLIWSVGYGMAALSIDGKKPKLSLEQIKKTLGKHIDTDGKLLLDECADEIFQRLDPKNFAERKNI